MKFVRDIQLGSIITTVIVLLVAAEVWLFYSSVEIKVTDAWLTQKQNTASITYLHDEFALYKTERETFSADILRRVSELQAQVNDLQEQVHARYERH